MTAPSLKAIRGQVARDLGVQEAELASAIRAGGVTHARHVGMALCRALTGHNQTMIARAFGMKSPCTVKNAIALIEARLETDARFRAEFEALKHACTVQLAAIGPAVMGFTTSNFSQQLSEAFSGIAARLFAHMRRSPGATVAMLERGLDELDARASQLTELSHQVKKGPSR